MKDSITQLDSSVTYTHILNVPDSLAIKLPDSFLEQLTAVIEATTKEDRLLGLFSYDAVFAVCVTVFVFASGIVADRLIKKRDKNINQKELRIYFKHFLDKITDNVCPNLADMYRDTYQKYGINEGIPVAPPKILTSDFVRVRNIQDKDLFHAFKDKESLSDILSNLDFLELMINEIDSFHKRIRTESDKLRSPLQEDVNKYFDALSDYVEHVRINNPQYPNRDAFRDLVNNSILKYHQQEGYKKLFTKVYHEIIRPIQEQVVKKNILRNDPLGLKIADLGRDISFQYNYLKRLTIEFRLDYRKFSKKVKESQDRLEEARGEIKWD